MASVVWLRVSVHGTIDKAVGVVFRCTLSGSDADRWLEIPAWMFDRTACADQATLSTNPFVDMAALSTLGNLLAGVLKAQPPSSNAPLSGCACSKVKPAAQVSRFSCPGHTVVGMIALLSALCSLFLFRVRSRAALELELVAMRHQMTVLRRQRPGRPQLFSADRLLWVWLYRI